MTEADEPVFVYSAWPSRDTAEAASAALGKITIADLLAKDPASLAGFAPHASCPVAA